MSNYVEAHSIEEEEKRVTQEGFELVKNNILQVATQSTDKKLLKIYSEIIALMAKEYIHKIWPQLVPVSLF